VSKCLQYGSGFDGPEEWINFDASPMIILAKIPVFGKIIQKKRNLYISENIKYGNIVNGLLKHNGTCDAVYCSHVLEHLTYEEFITAIGNTYLLLKKGGVFRLVMPDLRKLCENYLKDEANPKAAVEFINGSGMALRQRRKLRDRIISVFANSRHQWLWDYNAAKEILERAGFTEIRICEYNDSAITEFKMVENKERFNEALAIEAKK
jgi:predicted SAM-dependent methyltransferase